MALQGGSAPRMLGRVVGKHTDSCVVPASLKGVSVQNNMIPNTEGCQERKPRDRRQGPGEGTGRGGPGKFQAVSIRGLLPHWEQKSRLAGRRDANSRMVAKELCSFSGKTGISGEKDLKEKASGNCLKSAE